MNLLEQLGGNLVPITAIVCAFFFVVIWVLAATLDSIYKTKTNAQIKQRLIERGDTASDIDRILKAGGPETWQANSSQVPPVPPVKQFS